MAEDDDKHDEDLDQPVLEPLHPGDDVEQVESSHDCKREQAQADDSHQGWASIVLRLRLSWPDKKMRSQSHTIFSWLRRSPVKDR